MEGYIAWMKHLVNIENTMRLVQLPKLPFISRVCCNIFIMTTVYTTFMEQFTKTFTRP